MLTLPPLPDHVQLVTDEDDERLRSQFNLPSGPSECPTCLGHQIFLFYNEMRLPIDEREIVQYQCSCYEQIVLQRYFLNHGVGNAYAQLWWADADGVDPVTKKAAVVYGDQIERNVSTGIGLYLHGGHGNGKSMVSSLLFKLALHKGIDGYWITLNELLSRYQDTWRDKAYRNWFDRRMRNAALLVVDDMGREFEGRTTATSSIDSIFRTRAQNGLATIITTNLDDDEFTKRYTKGITSLVEEACDRVEVTGADWRSIMRERKKVERDLGISRPFAFGIPV